MKRGAILEAARRDNSELLKGALILLAATGAVLAFNWRYVYNWCAGPFHFDSRLSAAPGAREFVRAEGPLAPTGVVEETTVRLLRGLAETKSVSARFLAMFVEGRLLVVKVESDFAGPVVEGRLVPLPDAVRTALPAQANPHPWLVDAHIGYRWDFNLFVMVAAPLFVVSVLLVIPFAWRAADVARHPALAGLKKLGDPLGVVHKIENEMAMAGEKGRAGPLWFTASWLVTLEPSLNLCALADVVGVAHSVTPTKSGAKNTVRLWLRGQFFSKDLDVSAEQAQVAMEGVKRHLPSRVVEDVKAFERRWADDQGKSA